MNEDKAREHLVRFVKKYVHEKADQERLIAMINRNDLPQVPVKGVLAELHFLKCDNYDQADQLVLQELVYYFV